MYGWRKLRPWFFPAQGRPPKKGIHGRIKWSGCQRIQQAMSGGKKKSYLRSKREKYQTYLWDSLRRVLIAVPTKLQLRKADREIHECKQKHSCWYGNLPQPRHEHWATHISKGPWRDTRTQNQITSNNTPSHFLGSKIYRSRRLKILHCWLHARNSKRRDFVRVDFHVVWKRSDRGGREPPARKCIRRE